MTIFCSVGNLAQRPLENQRLGFFSPYSYYINLFLSCLVIKRTTPHFDSAPVHNGAKYFVISHLAIDFYPPALCDFLEYFLNLLTAIDLTILDHFGEVNTNLNKIGPVITIW